MAKFFRNARIYEGGNFITRNVYFGKEGLLFSDEHEASDEIIDNCMILPGFADVHVHLREPGFSYKETISTGSRSAARGGYTDVCSMPNLDPVPDSIENLEKQLKIIEKDACIRVTPYGSITKGEKGNELSDMEAMAPFVCAFSDDGKGVQSDGIMRAAMEKCAGLRKIIAAHCEVNELLHGGYIHDGKYAAMHGHAGISSASEYVQIARDIELSRMTGCAYHVCHISTKESVDLIRKAKARGVNITCETGPHYLLLCEDDLQEDGRFKMNPPLRSSQDREALIEGLKHGTIDMIATDHAPHSIEEKSKGLEKSLMGITGLETEFAVLYTNLVLKGVITTEKLVELMAENPRKRFGLKCAYPASTSGKYDDFTVFETQTPYTVDPEEFASMGRATPFAGWEVKGRCLLTVCGGHIAFSSEE